MNLEIFTAFALIAMVLGMTLVVFTGWVVFELGRIADALETRNEIEYRSTRKIDE